MHGESHARARFLVDQAATEGILPDEQRWLNSHTEKCAECSRYSELSSRAIRALDSLAFDMDPLSALRVENAIRRRANRLALNEFHRRRALVGAVVAMFLTIAGSVAMWQPAVWLAVRWSLPNPGWQAAFAMFWILPSALLGMLPYFRRGLMGNESAIEGQTI